MEYLSKELWIKCKICGYKCQGGDNRYLSQDFLEHIKKHDLTLNDYFFNICGLKRGKCKCGICDKDTTITRKSANFRFKKYECGRNEQQIKWSEWAKNGRRGNSNPMFGKKPWNKGLDKNTSQIIKRISDNRLGAVTSEETKEKQRLSAKKREIHGMQGKKHSDETCEKFRQITLKRIKDGVFKQTETKPVRIMKSILDKLNIKYESEKIVHYYSFDLYLPNYNLYIEVDGDYFHSNPKIYKNGPKTKTQKINWYRDIKKNKYVEENGIKLIRFWESDIINNSKEIELCLMKELSL